ncbi:MAG: ribosomal protein S18-alanine N-acetyltransferase [Agathobacter sp.]|nr:ribosomal protein S18-alanine N-acetyltransferase [Agathobacter sp.]
MLIREMTLQDVPAVAEIEKKCFSLPWSEQSLIDSVVREDTLFLVCEDARNIVGYIGMYLSFDEGDITNVAVAPAQRKKGYGEALVAKAIALAKERDLEMILLEVRVSNTPAISLYKKMGFEELGLRKKFYEHPVEDALIMKCPL